MNRSAILLLAFLSLSCLIGLVIGGQGQTGTTTEYYVKAAFVCQLTRFIEWPKGKAAEPNAPTIIGIVGKDPFGDAFEIARDSRQAKYAIKVRRFKPWTSPDLDDPNQKKAWEDYVKELKSCHILYFVGPRQDSIKQVLQLAHSGSVLTIGESEGFLEYGGIMNLLIPNPKIRFEVNLVAARQARIRIPAQVLRLAARVIDKKAGG
ncbi:MAG: YfiR family protein [Sedimentisphaerales bacterium]|jgi:hypothetical protein|nr:YfiR family protein [Sedimentisphaerales bacterium]